MGVLTAEEARKISLLEALLEEAQEQGHSVLEPDHSLLFAWSEQEIQAYVAKAVRGPAPEAFAAPDPADFQKWFPGLKLSGTACESPRLRVLCFANAGSAEDLYTSEGTGSRRAPSPLLVGLLIVMQCRSYDPETVSKPHTVQEWCRANAAECLAVQTPGRNMRRGEPFLSSPQAVAQALLPIVASSIANVPYIVIAHSVGTWNAYELLVAARQRGLPMPVRAFLSAMAAPSMAEGLRPWRKQQSLDEAAFQEECRGWDVSEVIFTPAMWSVYQDVMRADFTLFDSYVYTHADEAKFSFPVHAFWGMRDRRISQAMVQGWADFTSGPFQLTGVAGHHLWPLVKETKATWLQLIADDCRKLLADLP